MQCNGLEIQTAIQIHCRDDVSFFFVLTREQERNSKKGQTYCNVGTIPLTPAPAPGVAAGVAGVTTLPVGAEPSAA